MHPELRPDRRADRADRVLQRPGAGRAVPLHREPKHEYGWVSPYHFGINQGPIVNMIENHRSGFLWSLMRQCPHLVGGLRRAGFSGGWLE